MFRKIIALMLCAAMLVAAYPATADDLAITAPIDVETTTPSEDATEALEDAPVIVPEEVPTEAPTEEPVEQPTEAPTEEPVELPTEAPTEEPVEQPSEAPTEEPVELPTEALTEEPVEQPSDVTTEEPTEAPTDVPTEEPTRAPTDVPTEEPTEAPTDVPTEEPTEAPTEVLTEEPTEAPTDIPTEEPSEAPTDVPTEEPTEAPTEVPTEEPTEAPTEVLTEEPTEIPTEVPTELPTEEPELTPEPLPLEIALSVGVRSAFAGDTVTLTLTVAGGAGQLSAACQVLNGQQTIANDAMLVVEGENIYAFSPAAYGEHTIRFVVTDEAGQTAEASATLPVAEHDTTSLDQWTKLAKAVKLTDSWQENLIAVAKSQIGYTESVTDFIILEDGRHAYSIYGDWMKSNYAEWSAAFVSFCMEYANIPSTAFPRSATVEKLLSGAKGKGIFESAGDYAPAAGDVVFFKDENHQAARAGIVIAVSQTGLRVAEGLNGAVSTKTYAQDDPTILGYANMTLAIRKISLVVTPAPTPEEPVADETTEEPTDEYDIAPMNAAGSQDYEAWTKATLSYLVERGSGYMSVELVDNNTRILIKNLDSDFNRLAYRYIDLELPIFGGFYAGTDAYYLAFGQNNDSENDSVEVMRIVKYDKSWNRLGAASLHGANTVHPYAYSNMRAAETSDYLYIRTGHEMYADDKGTNHQANLTMQIRKSDMTIVDAHYEIANTGAGYVSHSLNQFIIVDDENNLIALDHGDSYPRSFVLSLCSQDANTGIGSYWDLVRFDLLTFAQHAPSYQYTRASVGGLEYSSSHYLVAGNSVKQDGGDYYTRNIFVTATSRSNFSESGTTFKWITSYPEGGSQSASTPQFVKLGANSFLLLWEPDDENISYVFLDGKGNTTSSIYTKPGALSDCKPVVKNGVASWYITDAIRTITYSITSGGAFSQVVNDFVGIKAPSGKFGENNALQWLIGTDGTLTISGQGAMPDFAYDNTIWNYNQPWYEYQDSIQRIVIQNGVTAIGKYAFALCDSATSVSIPDSMEIIGWGSFLYTGLTSVTIPSNVTTIDYFAFSACANLTSVAVKSLDCWIGGRGTLGSESVYALGDPKKVTITGELESTAEEYAAQYGYKFRLFPLDTPQVTNVTCDYAGIRITWGTIDGAVNYRVYYKVGTDSNWYVLGDTTATSYTWADARYGTQYTFTVRCVSANGKYDASNRNNTGMSIIRAATPSAPTVSNTTAGVNISWPEAAGASKYRVLYKTGNGAWTTLVDTAATSYTWTAAKSGATYAFTVRCISDDSKRYTSGFDEIGTSITYLAAPKIASVAGDNAGIRVTWGAVPGAVMYRVYYRNANTGGSWTKLMDTPDTSCIRTGAVFGTPYTFAVRCVSADGKVLASGMDPTGVTITRVATPKVSKVENVVGGIKITWGKVSGAGKYRVYYKTASSSNWAMLADTTDTNYTWAGAQSGVSYAFTVRCLSADGSQFTSGYDTTGVSITNLATPKITTAAGDNSGLRITWNAVAGAAMYRVYYKTPSSTNWVKLVDTKDTSYIRTGASFGTKYTFTVCCVSADGKEITSGMDSTGMSITRVATPKVTKVESAAGGIKITWGAVSGAGKYRVYYKTGNGTWTTLASTTGTSYLWSNATSGVEYAFTVRCLSDDGSQFTSGYDLTGVSIKYVAIPQITTLRTYDSGIRLVWNEVAGAGKYRVYYKTNASGGWIRLLDTTATSYSWSGAAKGTTYTFTVRCLSADGSEFLSGLDSTGKSFLYQ